MRYVIAAGSLLLALAARVDAAVFDIPPGDVAALKAAIVTANSNSQDDIINLAPGATYALTTVDNTSANGPNGLPVLAADGGRTLTINGNGGAVVREKPENWAAFRIMEVAPSAAVTINQLTLRGGAHSGNGGCIYQTAASLTLVDCTLTANSVGRGSNDADPARGGAIYLAGGTVILQRCTLSRNVASAYNCNYQFARAMGGAIFNNGGTVEAQLCTFSSNRAEAGSYIICGGEGTGSVDPSKAYASGGAIENVSSSTQVAELRVANSTFSGNVAQRRGNSLTYLDGIGGAINNVQSDGSVAASVVIGSSILAGPGGQLANAGGSIASRGYNLCEGDTAALLDGPADQANVKAQLHPLAANGGPTETHAPAVGSPALDKGKADAVSSLAALTDQRGMPRVHDFPGRSPAMGGDGSDIGAFEKQAPELVVTTTADHDDGSCDARDCTLREAIRAANADPNLDTIVFAEGVTGTIDLLLPLPAVMASLDIGGPGANALNVRRGTAVPHRILTLGTQYDSPRPTVSIFGLTLANGQAPDASPIGGGVLVYDGVLWIESCELVGNSAVDGGAVFVDYPAEILVSNSAITGNTATDKGGGIFNALGSNGVTILNTTLSGNAAIRGAAFYNAARYEYGYGAVKLQSSTLADNSGEGGIYNLPADAKLQLQNTILRGASGSATIVARQGTIFSDGNNISSDAAGGDSGAEPGGLLSGPGDKRNTDPLLDPAGLQYNGGTTQTIALQPGSPAVDAANSAFAPHVDQRGVPRQRAADIGAFEFLRAVPTPTPTPTPSASPDASARRLGNVSTRARVETGENVLIGGFIVRGSSGKKLMLRAVGPSLDLEGALADPQIEIYDGGGQLIGFNDDWGRAPNAQEISESTIAPAHDLEAAVLETFSPGAYTAVVSGVRDAAGIALVEAYDLGQEPAAKLANISTRGRVLTEEDVMIGGLIVLGSRPQTVIIRAIGPSLDVQGKLLDPVLELHDGNGTLLQANDNWRSEQEAEIVATTIPPTDDLESAIVRSLAPAAYTAVVRGVNGSIGIGLVEVYALD